MIKDNVASSDEKPGKPVIPDSIPVPMLPPRKRLKASQSDYSINDRTAEVSKSDHPKDRFDDIDLETLLESDVCSVVRPDETKAENFCFSPAVTGTVAAISASNAVAMTNLNSAAKKSFASLSAPVCRVNPPAVRQKPPALRQEPVRRGRKPRQTTAVAVSTNTQPVAVYPDWTATNGSGGISVVQPALPQMVATPTPNVIHIPDDARVLQTDDGMIIVCQSDGTVQIHGHTEGQPIPLDAIRSLLALEDETQFAVSDSKQITQETSHSLYGQTIPLTSLQTEYEMTDQTLSTVVDAQNLVSIDGRQYVAVDGSQTLMAYDPNTQSMVPIDPTQTFITLSDDNTFVTVDGGQPVLSIDGVCHAEQAVVGNSALIQLLPSDHMQ